MVTLPGLIRAAGVLAAELAQRAPGLTFEVLELPGVGGSAGVAPAQAQAALAAAILAMRAERAPVLAFDLARGLTAEIRAAVLLVDAGADWPAPPELAPRADGTHLTTLFAHVRSAHVLDAAQRRAAAAGAALPDAAALDAAVVAAATRPAAFAELWSRCLAGRPAPQAERCPDLDAALARLRRLAAAEPAPPLRCPGAPEPPGASIWCDYAETPRGRIHLRRAGSGGLPVIALASAPGSAAPLAPVIAALARTRQVAAPDYLGNGGSDKPAGAVDIALLAGDVLALADGLGFAQFDLWGTHTGALIALETSLLAPGRVRRMVLEAPPLLPPAFNADILQRYFPRLEPHPWGLHLQQAWNMRRDMFLFWPWYSAARANARPLDLPDAAFLHDWTVGLLQSGATYDRSYRAAFEYDTPGRLASLRHPALVCAGPSDMLAAGLARARDIAPEHVTLADTPATAWYPNQDPGAVAETLARYSDFLAG